MYGWYSRVVSNQERVIVAIVRYLVPYFLKKDPPSKTSHLSHMAGLDIDCMVHVLKQSTTAGLNVFCTNYFCGKSCQQILPNSRVNVNKESIRNLARKQVKKYVFEKKIESLH